MLRLPRFDVVSPETVPGVIEALAVPGARLVAGGTDILPNLKHRLDRPPRLVSLARVRGLRDVRVDGQILRIGAGVTLTDMSVHPEVQAHAPSLARAAGLVASPSIRNMGTLGGNIHLDTRCRYVNQTDFWRSAIGGCLKAEGVVCHVVPGGKNCVAAMSSDCVPVLTSLDATLSLVGAEGARTVAIADYYNSDGTSHINKQPGELLTEIRVPLAPGPRRVTYAKWTVRSAIDFPLVSVALCIDLDADSVDARIVAARVCVGVLNAAPRQIKRTNGLVGKKLSDTATVEALCDLVHKQSKPLPNVPYDAPYRRKMIPVYTRRALAALISAG